jgi:hypothetical protein
LKRFESQKLHNTELIHVGADGALENWSTLPVATCKYQSRQPRKVTSLGMKHETTRIYDVAYQN